MGYCPKCNTKFKKDTILFAIIINPPGINYLCPACKEIMATNDATMIRLINRRKPFKVQ